MTREPITPAIQAELDRLTGLDRVIYRAALRKFDRLQRMPAG